MELDLRGRVVIVTGAARGIGAKIAERFAAEGARVFAFDLAFPPPGESPQEPRIEPVICNVADPQSVSSAVDHIASRHGRIDVLVNNAGINALGDVADLEWEKWRTCFDVNVGGVFLMSQAVAEHMKRAGSGRILNAASFAAIIPSISSAAYAASKSAVVALTRVHASELGPFDITVNAYAPGMVPTAMNGFADMPQEVQDRLLDTLSLRRWETADDVADLLIFLASDRAAYITGTLHDVSGGKLATQIPAIAHRR